MSNLQRKQAPRLARPAARYWKGKAPKGVTEAHSDSDSDHEGAAEDEEAVGEQADDEDIEEFGVKQERELVKPREMNIALKDVSVSKEGKVIVAGREESGRTAMETGEESEEEEEEEEEVEVEEQKVESSEEESESEEEEKVEFRPTFVPKRARGTISERDALAQDTEEALKRRAQEIEDRRKESHDLVAQTIRRELAEKDKEEDVNEVDDTDGLDPAAEFEAWRLRELARIKMEKEEDLAREKEREEVERRRAMPEEKRMKEDLDRAKKLREEKPKGQQKFLQKYWHKGAFHQDEEILKKRDYTEATQSTVDVSLLPKVMQVKNFGKRSRTKYTHLVDQDTTGTGGFGGHVPIKTSGTMAQGCFSCGGPHLKKDCPENGRPTGANAVQSQNRRYEPRAGSWKDRDDRDDTRQDRKNDSYSSARRRSHEEGDTRDKRRRLGFD